MGQQFVYFSIPFIPLLPLLGALFAYLSGRHNRDSVGLIATCAAGLSCALSVVMVVNLPRTQAVENVLFRWFDAGRLSVDFAFRVDHLTAVMCLVITGIGTLVHVYSTGYMAHDEGRHRFFAYLNLFLSAMLVLVMGASLPILFVGWEGVGLCSYLLIGFWFKNSDYAKAGQKAFVMNRIGDAAFIVAMILIAINFGTLDFQLLRPLMESSSDLTVLTLIALALFIGATGKSAQIPLFTWLPDAMAGPTPVSALIHAATMVTAGIYLLARMHFLFSLSAFVLALIIVIALVTAFVAATTALFQNDIKKVLAYSTVSLLGFMFLAAGAGAYWVAIFHLVTHAFFKACLFLAAGAVIHACHHEQDMRRLGGLFRRMPLIGSSYLIATLAIAGIFPFAGFQSKHAILSALEHVRNPVLLPWVLDLLVPAAQLIAFPTALYMTRSFALTFLGKYKGEHEPERVGSAMTDTVLFLAALSLVGGIVLEFGLPSYLGSVLPGTAAASGHALQGLIAEFPSKLMESWIGISGVVIGVLLFSLGLLEALFRGALGRLLLPVRILLENKYFFDEIYELMVERPAHFFAQLSSRFLEPGIFSESPRSIAESVEVSGELLRHLHAGQVRVYAFLMLTGALFVFGFYLLAM